ncbi:FAD binding domain-containing protein [Mycena floridula]|nr:FAD binding domain-containing protein [Mycena floridula]
MSTSKDLVLVVGGGPTGLTMALDLARRGVNVRVIEERTEHHNAAREQPRTIELLAILGVEQDLLNIAKTFEWSEPAEDSPTIPFRRTCSISQAELEKILRGHLKSLGCEVEMGQKLIGIVQHDSAEKVAIQIQDVANKSEYTIECCYLVAADGAKSRSRRFIGAQFLGESKVADRMWTANVEVHNFSREYWHRWGDFGQAATTLKPLYPEPLFQIQSLGPSLPNEIPMDLAGMQDLFNSISKRTDIQFQSVQWVSEWKANIRMTDRFSVGRVFLAGDACHCHSVAGGQGNNTAIQDAFNLGWKLALVMKKIVSPALLLTTYETERMPVAAEMLNLTSELHTKAWQHIPASAFSRQESSADDPMMRSSKLLQLNINYRWSPILYDERDQQVPDSKNPYGTTGEKVRAGDRAPVLRFRWKQTIIDQLHLLGKAGSHLLLVFPGSSSSWSEDVGALQKEFDPELLEIVAIIEENSAPDLAGVQYLTDMDNVGRTVYGAEAERDVYVTIRPDNVIGAYTFGTAGIRKYFRGLGCHF